MADWTAVADRMPQPGVTVLAYYTNRCNKGRRIRAVWIPAKFEEASPESDNGEYDEENDCYWTPQGWYEQIDNWDDDTAVAVHEGLITHWMPMPPCPGELARPGWLSESFGKFLREQKGYTDEQIAAECKANGLPPPAGVPVLGEARACDTPAYCGSVQRCTRADSGKEPKCAAVPTRGVGVLPGQPKRVGWFVFIDGEWKQSTKYAESALPLYELPDGVKVRDGAQQEKRDA